MSLPPMLERSDDTSMRAAAMRGGPTLASERRQGSTWYGLNASRSSTTNFTVGGSHESGCGKRRSCSAAASAATICAWLAGGSPWLGPATSCGIGSGARGSHVFRGRRLFSSAKRRTWYSWKELSDRPVADDAS